VINNLRRCGPVEDRLSTFSLATLSSREVPFHRAITRQLPNLLLKDNLRNPADLCVVPI